MSLRDRLDCLVDFVGMILLCLLPPCRTPSAPFRLQLHSPNCFFRVCFPKLFAADLKDFLPLITSAISGAANSNMSAPLRFAKGIYQKELIKSKRTFQQYRFFCNSAGFFSISIKNP